MLVVIKQDFFSFLLQISMWVLLGSLTSAQHPHLNDLQEANVSPIKASKLKKKSYYFTKWYVSKTAVSPNFFLLRKFLTKRVLNLFDSIMS